jgi:hypothetical protein
MWRRERMWIMPATSTTTTIGSAHLEDKAALEVEVLLWLDSRGLSIGV